MGFFRKLWRDERGNALMLVGAATPLLMGFAGLASDTIQWTLWKRQLQRAADSAAIAGVYQRVQGANQADVTTAVNRDLTYNHKTGMALQSGYPAITLPADDGVMRQQVNVTLAIRKALPFSAFFLSNPPLVTATARAASIPGTDEYCMGALDPSASVTGITVSGNAEIDMNCGAICNARSADSCMAKGSSVFKATVIAGAGGIKESSNWRVGKYDPYTTPIADPYANVKPKQEDLDSCPNGNGNANQLSESTDTSSFVPGAVHCFNSLSVGSNTSLVLPAGTYYINGGDAFIQGNLSGTGVTIVLTNKSSTSTSIGNLKVNADANINLTAPSSGCTLGTDGCFKGIAIYQDRRAVDSNSAKNKINGNSGSQVTGAIYFPNQELDYNGTGNTEAVCTRFIAKRLIFSGNSTMSNKFKKDCPGAGLDPIIGGRRVRLVA